MLTLFAMVLAIGILVDDAIVVVENVERIMSEEGLPPREATRKAMKQITGAIVGITLVLVAVFVPMAFFPGLGRHHLSAVFRHHGVGHRLLRVHGAVADAGSVRHACSSRLRPAITTRRKGFFGLFNRGMEKAEGRLQRRSCAGRSCEPGG